MFQEKTKVENKVFESLWWRPIVDENLSEKNQNLKGKLTSGKRKKIANSFSFSWKDFHFPILFPVLLRFLITKARGLEIIKTNGMT